MTDNTSDVPVSGDTALQTAILEGLSEAVNYRGWLASLAIPWLGEDPIEVGSGTGDYAAMWADLGFSIVATEADPGRLHHLRKRFSGHPRIHVDRLRVPVTRRAEHSAVVAYNVLEHIDDDLAALRGFGQLVRPAGHVIVLVPAFPVGMSRFDREIGHFRRYRRQPLARRIEEAGFEVVDIHYINPVGLVAWIVGMRMLRRRPSPGLAVRTYDRMVPLLRRLETGRRPIFGQSIFAVARRADG